MVEDLVAPCLHVMGLPEVGRAWVKTLLCSQINAGTGVHVSIGELSQMEARVMGLDGG